MSLLSNSRFLVVYSATVTIAFAATVFYGISHSSVLAASGKVGVDFDQINVRRINIVEPDGTTRLVIADSANYPGGFFKGKELARPDRKDEAGMLFMNNEGTENGGLIFGGYKEKDGTIHSWGHLSFDQYEKDQALTQDMQQEGTQEKSGYAVNDNAAGFITPEVIEAYNKVSVMPKGTPSEAQAAQKAMDQLRTKYPIKTIPRAYLGREADASATLHLRDADGHDRILLRVAPNGAPQMQFLAADGKVTEQWPKNGR